MPNQTKSKNLHQALAAFLGVLLFLSFAAISWPQPAQAGQTDAPALAKKKTPTPTRREKNKQRSSTTSSINDGDNDSDDYINSTLAKNSRNGIILVTIADQALTINTSNFKVDKHMMVRLGEKPYAVVDFREIDIKAQAEQKFTWGLPAKTRWVDPVVVCLKFIHPTEENCYTLANK